MLPPEPSTRAFATTRNYVAEGDSITAVGGGMFIASYAVLPGFHTKSTVAVSGATLGDVISRAATTDTYLVAGALNVLTLLIGANSLGDTSQYPTVNNYLTALAGYCDARRAAGWYVLLETMLPIGTNNGVNVHNTRRATCTPEMLLWTTNGSIVPGKHADQVFNLAADPIMGPDNSQQANSAYWGGDGVHPSTLGYDRITAISKVPISGASAADVSRAPPTSVTRILWLTPTREVGSPYTTFLATGPLCNWTLLGGSDPGFTLTGSIAAVGSTYIGPVDTISHPASSVGTFVANLSGVDAFGNTYTPVLTLTVTPVNSTLNVAPNGGRFDTYYATQLTSRTTDGSTGYGIEEVNGNPAFALIAIGGAGYTQANIGNTGPTVNGTYEWSYRTWKDRPGTTVPTAITGADALFSPPARYIPATTPELIQGTYTQSAQSVITGMLFYLNSPSGIVVGEKAYLDDFELRQVLGPIISAPVFANSGQTTARVSLTTAGSTGTMYAVLTATATRPTKAQIKAGQNDLGATAFWSGSKPITASGQYIFDITGLSAATTYNFHFVHETSAGFSNTLWISGATRDSAATTWSPVNKGPLMTLSNGNMTVAKASGSSNWQSIVASNGVSNGVYSYTVTIAGTTANAIMGMSNVASPDTVGDGWYPGINGDINFGWQFGPNVIQPGAYSPAVSAPAVGDTVELVLDIPNKRVRVRNVTKAAGTYSAWFDMSMFNIWTFGNGGLSLYPMVGINDTTVNLTGNFSNWGSFDTGITGTLAATDTKDVAALAGQSSISGTLTATDTKDVAALAAQFSILGALATTETTDTASLVGAGSVVSGALAATDARDVAAITGSVTLPVVSGTLAATDAKDIAVLAGIELSPVTLDLIAASDTGSSSTDNITADTSPDLDVTFPDGVVVNDIFSLYDNSVLIGSHTFTANEVSAMAFSITMPTLSTGTHPLTATLTRGPLISPTAAPLSVTINPSPP